MVLYGENMSNFNCEQCGIPSVDSSRGYISGCKHYPPDSPVKAFGFIYDLELMRSRRWSTDQYGTKRFDDGGKVVA